MMDEIKIRKELNRSVVFFSIMKYVFSLSFIGTAYFIFDILKLLDVNGPGRFLLTISLSIFFSCCAAGVVLRFDEAKDKAKECLKKLDNLICNLKVRT